MFKCCLGLLFAGLLFADQVRAETSWVGIQVQVYPRCVAGRPQATQPLHPSLTIELDRGRPAPEVRSQFEALSLGARRLALVDGEVSISSEPRAGEPLTWKVLGRVDPGLINCAWATGTLKLHLAPQLHATLSQDRHGDCLFQDGDIPFLDGSYTRPTGFRLELRDREDLITANGAGSTWYDSHWACLRARGVHTQDL